MDKFFRSFLEMKWNIGNVRVSFLDALLFVALTGSGLIMRVALMGGLTGWYGVIGCQYRTYRNTTVTALAFFICID